MAINPNTGGYTGISLAGNWECGSCGASGDGWYDEDDGLGLHDANGQPFAPHEQGGGEASRPPSHSSVSSSRSPPHCAVRSSPAKPVHAPLGAPETPGVGIPLP